MGYDPKANRARLNTALDLLRKGQDFVQLCIDHPHLLLMRDTGMTLLHHAIVLGNEGAVNQLLALPRTADAVHVQVDANPLGKPEYAGMDAVQLAEYLARSYSNTLERSSFGAIHDTLVAERDGQPAFMNAVAGYPGYNDTPDDMQRRLKVIDRMLERHPGYIDAPEHGTLPLSMAAWKGQTQIVERLLEKGANPLLENEGGNFRGMTPRQIVQREWQMAKGQASPVAGEYPAIIKLLEGAEQQWQQGAPARPFTERTREKGAGERMP